MGAARVGGVAVADDALELLLGDEHGGGGPALAGVAGRTVAGLSGRVGSAFRRVCRRWGSASSVRSQAERARRA